MDRAKNQNEKVLYRVILRDAWQAVRSRKDLWFWGIFAALLGSAGEYHFMMKTLGQVANQQAFTTEAINFLQAPPLTFDTWRALGVAFSSNLTATFTLLIIVLAIIAIVGFLLWLVIGSVVALIKAGSAAANGKTIPNLSEGMKAAHTHFGSTLVLFAFGRMITTLLVAVLVLFGTLAARDLLVGGPMFVVAFLMLVPALFAVSFAVRFAVCAVVIDDSPLLTAIGRAKELVRAHWLVSLELALILSLINIAVGLVLVALTALLVIPFVVAAAVLAQLGAGIWSVWCLLFGVVLFLGMLFTFGGALGAYYWVVWSELFVKLRQPGYQSKIKRMVGHLLRVRGSSRRGSRA